MKHSHRSLTTTRSASVLAVLCGGSFNGDHDVGLSTFSIDNDPPRESSEKGGIQSEGVPATGE